MPDTVTSNVGKWDPWYKGLSKERPQAYGDMTTYLIAAEFLGDCPVVADWGCGKGFFGTVCKSEYVGVDGTQTPFSDVVCDLVDEHPNTYDGILLRHVLEHNYDWQAILDNAIKSAQHKLCIVLFTPCGEETKEIAFTESIGVPDMSFAITDILKPLINSGAQVSVMELKTNTQYGVETVIKATWRATYSEGVDDARP